ncbi:MAG TPA: DNA ligase D [Solirubrobacteraceae bacterium]|nr:DNA ligase D [Solirubrobacteraceae bacterium]
MSERTRAGKLGEYQRKRSFKRTPEPSGEGSRDGGGSRFVVHEHHARRLHWDLRLERDGALASWAIPNGIPTDPKRNRKAVHVEDHPLDYIDFAGTIPAGNYGAGEVSIWDSGTYECQKWREDEVIVVFHGERLTGRYALFRAGRDEKDWMIHRMDPAIDPTAAEIPEFVPPMLAKLSTLPADDSDWAFEVKWDGVRAITRSQPGRLHLMSRNGNDITGAYPELRGLNAALGSHEAVLDGEIVAFDRNGRPSFQALQSRMHLRGEAKVKRLAESAPVTYMLFDLIWLDGHSLCELPYSQRRAQLEALGINGDHWHVPEFHRGDGEALLAATREQGLEGVVAKRLDARYLPGKRAGWIKIKHSRRQELVIGGWTSGKGARASSLGALHLGVHDGEGVLRYAGRVGTGFDERELKRLLELLEPLRRGDSPFTGRQPPRGAHFVEPELVCEVEFSEWTHAGTLRQPSYKGLREDKPAAEVVRERESDPEEGIEEAAAHPEPAGDGLSRAGSSGTPPELERLVQAGKTVRGGVEIEVEGRTLKLSNLDKVLYPQTGLTKSDVIAYYMRIAPVLLPHLHDRPLTLKRYPDGVQGKFFYEKRSPAHRPDWVEVVTVPSDRAKGEIPYTLCQDLPTLIWLANLADIELHPLLSLGEDVSRPTALAFDLDPGAPATIVECCEVALHLRELFEQLGLHALAKTSGSKGLQVYVPLNQPSVSYADTKPFARAVAELFEQRHPKLVVSAQARQQRQGKVLIDWSQNDEHKTTVSVYSLRAKEPPGVSTPLAWSEVESCARKRDPELLSFAPEQVLTRVMQDGDLFGDLLSMQQTLPKLEE